MKEKPIIFSSEMICAILEGRKTMTRREVKGLEAHLLKVHQNAPQLLGKVGEDALNEAKSILRYPYKVGQLLWVRETFCAEADQETMEPTGKYHYAATCDLPLFAMDDDGFTKLRKNGEEASPWKSPIFMPRKASRITLEITNIRVERLNEISEEDCWAEGVEDMLVSVESKIFEMAKKLGMGFEDAKPTFAAFWERLKGKDSWKANPFVWVIQFKRIEEKTA